MINLIFSTLRGIFSLFCLITITFMVGIPLISLAFLKRLPWPALRHFCTLGLQALSNLWIRAMNVTVSTLGGVHFDIQGAEGLNTKKWYLLISNHQSWIDIFVLMKSFSGRLPAYRFFVKKSVTKIPVIGTALRGLNFPIMQRYSKEFLKRFPHLKGKDLETTQKSCRIFRTMPVTIINFLEGTRFTREKKQAQNSPYERLLKPHAGGVAHVLKAMGEQMSGIVNTTIIYPKGVRSFWGYLCGKVDKIIVRVELLPIPAHLIGDYNDLQFKRQFQEWVNRLWIEKDKLLLNANTL
jgi:1-acyl-sn-glycerol-3-phosphate acyltransferase